LGAIKQWVELQKIHQSLLFCIVDLHAITVPQDPQSLQEASLETTATYLACGIDPVKSAVFLQSSVPEHTELSWILNCLTPIGWLNRMTQFKDKAGSDRDQACLGLYAYPVLMAADILVYQATHVPVGEDQKQHLELARDIAGAFNRFVGEEFFTLPEPLITGLATRVMSLKDGTKKMSKSDPSDLSRIHLTDDNDAIRRKCAKAKTDLHAYIGFDQVGRPDVANLISIYAALSGQAISTIVAEYDGRGMAQFKQSLADLLIAELEPIRHRLFQYLNDKAFLYDQLKSGRDQARLIAGPIVHQVKDKMGFLNVGLSASSMVKGEAVL
jgi:tryptophanyl-tRNA synthetase